MSDFTAKRFDEMEAKRGVFRRAAAELGVTSFGMSVQDHPAGSDHYPDHAEPDQEEVYLALSGSGEIDIQGARVPLDTSVFVRVGAGTRHKVLPGPQGLRLLALGGIPGQPYQPPDFSKIEIDGEGSPKADFEVKRIEEMEAIYGGGFYKVRAELGLTSFGIQVFDLPPGFDRYPEHDHSEDRQEEVYIPLSGEAELAIDGETVRLEPGMAVRIAAGTKRKIVTGESPIRVLALGGVPGEAYQVKRFTELGEPDPLLG